MSSGIIRETDSGKHTQTLHTPANPIAHQVLLILVKIYILYIFTNIMSLK